MAQKSLFKNLSLSYQTAFLGNDINRFKNSVKMFVDQATDEEKKRFFKINADSVSKVFMTECKSEDHFYEKLQRVNEQRYIIPYLKRYSLEYKDDERFGSELRKILEEKKRERKWRDIYQMVKDYSNIQIAVLAREAIIGVNTTQDVKADVALILKVFGRKQAVTT